MGENGAGSINLGNESSGGTGFNPAAMMAGMAMGTAIGQNTAGMMNNMMQGLNGQQPYAPQSPQAMTPPPIPSVSYHVVQNGQATGPFDITVLTQMLNNGQLTKDSLVWKQGMPNWEKAGAIQELQPLFGQVPPAVPPIPTE